jgi:hypothetical protein
MLLTEFVRTRVLELAVHGLDLAAALDRQPWMTLPAAQVTEELLLPSPAAARLRAAAGWDRTTLIAKLTGRAPVTTAEDRLIQACAIQRLVLILAARWAAGVCQVTALLAPVACPLRARSLWLGRPRPSTLADAPAGRGSGGVVMSARGQGATSRSIHR